MHYIAMSGLHGYLPQFCTSCTTRKDAVDTLSDLHEMSHSQQKDLRRTGSVELKPYQGAEYANITECSCGDPERHCDD